MTQNTIEKYFTKSCRLVLFLLSGLFLTLGWIIDTGSPGLGAVQILLGVAGVLLIVISAFDKNCRFSPKLLFTVVSIYCALLIGELVVRILTRLPQTSWRWQAGPVSNTRQYRGLHTIDPVIGYTLTPNWQAPFKENCSQGMTAINSLRQRDDEPSASAKHRILLIGDSMTFGSFLDQSETIDKQIERFSGDIDAYNLAVGGYGLPAIIETFKRCKLPAQEVFYLFFNNDLSNNDLLLDTGRTVIDGFLVPNKTKKGVIYKEADLQKQIAVTIDKQETRKPVVDLRLLFLTHIRQLISTAIHGYRNRNELKLRSLLDGDPGDFSEENVKRAVSYTKELSLLVSAGNMKFYVVIIPTLGEVRANKYSWPTTLYLQGIENESIPVLELRQSLSIKHYFKYNGHFTPAGAKVAAKLICLALKPAEN